MIIDFECDSPTEEVKRETIALLKSGGGFVHRGYFAQFGHRWAEMLNLTFEELEEIVRKKGTIEAAVMVAEKYLEKTMTHQEFIKMLDEAGVTQACIGTTGMWASVEDTAAMAREFPGRLLPFFRSSPHEGMPNVQRFEQTVKEKWFQGSEKIFPQIIKNIIPFMPNVLNWMSRRGSPPPYTCIPTGPWIYVVRPIWTRSPAIFLN
jgi:hypothetical protein